MPEASESDDGETDLALIGRWQGGDERAATLLVARHADALARFVASVGERAAVADVVQDTFVRAFGSLDAFRGESSLRTWLFTIARRLVLDRRRAERREPERVALGETTAASAYDTLDSLVAVETQARVRAALARLTTLQREVFLLRVNDGLSYRDIARIVGSTEGAARVHYHNAMRAVKEMVNG